ncbi:MAG: hypothetical protein GF344_00980, partial [Chitinivibrionales bacterium]|nr:hypothetical protein [Chitinivibrionales bacterium]
MIAAVAEPLRIREVLAEFENHTYLTENRGVGLDVFFLAEPKIVALHPRGHELTFDTTSTHGRIMAGKAFFMIGRAQSDEKGFVEQGFRGTVQLEHYNRDSLMRGYISKGIAADGASGQLVDGYDTVSITTSLSAQGHWAARAYVSEVYAALPYVAFDIDAHVRAAEVREENFDPFFPLVEGTEIYHTDKYKLGREELGVAAVLSPSIGLGRRTNVTHLNAAFALERELKRCGAIHFSLADVTLARIAALLSRNDSYRLKNLPVARRFKAELDAILRTDAAVAPGNLTCLSPFV